MATSPWQAPPPLPGLPPSHLTKPLREMISAWQSFTVSPFKLSSSPFTHRLPGGGGRGGNKREMEGLRPPQSHHKSFAGRFELARFYLPGLLSSTSPTGYHLDPGRKANKGQRAHPAHRQQRL